jgi:hypothetical protein
MLGNTTINSTANTTTCTVLLTLFQVAFIIIVEVRLLGKSAQLA